MLLYPINRHRNIKYVVLAFGLYEVDVANLWLWIKVLLLFLEPTEA